MMPMLSRNLVFEAKLETGQKAGWLENWSDLKSDAICAEYNVPDSGFLFDDMAFETGSTVPEGRFIQPRIEAEIAFCDEACLWR